MGKLLAFSLFLVVAVPLSAADPIAITGTTCDFAIARLTIVGANFPVSATPVATLNGLPMTIISNTSNAIVAMLPPGTAPGSYELTVSFGKGAPNNATFVATVGNQGPKGDKGDPGPQGPKGDPGAQGPAGGAIASLESLEGIACTTAGGAAGHVHIAKSADNAISLTCVGPVTVPSAPTNLVAVAPASNEVDLSWSPVGGATSYDVYRSMTSGSGFVKVASRSGNGMVDFKPNNDVTTFFYVVRAVNSAGISAASAEVSVTTPAGLANSYVSDPVEFSCGGVGTGAGTAGIPAYPFASLYEMFISTNGGTSYPERVSVVPGGTGVSFVYAPADHPELARLVFFRITDFSGHVTSSGREYVWPCH